MYEYTTNGIKYISYKLGSLGAKFILYPDPEHTFIQLAAATDELSQIDSNANIRLASEDDRDFMYHRELFTEPEIQSLHWYQVNTDLIRSERMKGTSPKDYLKTYILPFVKQTEENYLKQFGTTIYEVKPAERHPSTEK